MNQASLTASTEPAFTPRRESRARQCPFLFAILACLQFLVLTVVAMLLYGGGTAANPAARGYHFFQNFFSDLGFTQTRLGTPNTASAVLFFVALTVAGLGLVVFSLAFPGFFGRERLPRVLSRLGAAAGIISGLSFVGIAWTPANVALQPHRFFVLVAFQAFFVAVLFFIAAITLSHAYPKRYALGFVAFGLVLGAYIGLLWFGPALGSDHGLGLHATGQKIVVYAAILTTLFEAEGARRLAAR